MVRCRLSLSLRYGLDRNALIRRDEDRECIWIVFCLCHEVGCNEGRISGIADDYDLGWPSEHVDRAIKGDKLLCRRDKGISRADDLAHGANRLCAIGKRSNGLRTANCVELSHAEQRRRRQCFWRRSW